jgi:dTDP-4-amino-4,6-dideoxygalactose transaminase
MKRRDEFSRRDFLATSSTVLVAGGLCSQNASGAADTSATLALHGGQKAVAAPAPRLVRWGQPEREQLDSIIGQSSLFYWKGPQTALLIKRFREGCPLEHVMSCSSGTAAIHIAVAAAGIGPDDEVITSPITDIGTVIGVLFQQAVPVFADLGRNSYNLDPDDVRRRITAKTKAIIAVHLAGNPCRMDALRTLADKHNLVLIEDCAQAWGARYAGQPIGTVGHVACFSLQQAKHVTCGDGGVVASSDKQIGPLLQRFGDKGMDRVSGNGLFESFATNYRMSELQAAFAAAQLGQLESIAAKRALLGNLLGEKIAGLQGIEPHEVRSDDRCTYWFYMFRVRPESLRCDRAEFVKALVAEGVPASAGYIPVLLFRNPVFQQHGFFAGRWPVKELGLTTMDYTQVTCPAAESILQCGVRISIHEGMSEAYVLSIAEAVRKVARHYAV